jgi:hypothetical protein
MKQIALVALLAFAITACQTYPKHAPDCKGRFTSLNPDYSYEKTKRADNSEKRSHRYE